MQIIPLSARAFLVAPWATTVVGASLTAAGAGGVGTASGAGGSITAGGGNTGRIGMAVGGGSPNGAVKGTLGGSPTGMTGATGTGIGSGMMGGCMGASSMGAGHQVGAHLLEGDDNGSKQIDKWGRALPRSRGVRVHLPRHAQQQNDVQVTRTPEHLSTLCWRGRIAHAKGRPRAAWVWVRSGWYL